MDTIVLCNYSTYQQNSCKEKPVREDDLPQNCEGIKYWAKEIDPAKAPCIWIKINCHIFTKHINVTFEDIADIKSTVETQLEQMDMTLGDFHISRIDYDYNFRLDSQRREALVETMRGLPRRIGCMNKSPLYHSIYFFCTSRHVQLYDKVHERVEKKKIIMPWEAEVCRQEIQCFPGHIAYVRQYYDLQPTWENWVNLDRQADYLLRARPIFLRGDFYPLGHAVELVQRSKLSPTMKERLCDDLRLISSGGLAMLKTKYSYNTYKEHLACFADLNISPLTLPQKYEYLGKIENPFFSDRLCPAFCFCDEQS